MELIARSSTDSALITEASYLLVDGKSVLNNECNSVNAPDVEFLAHAFVENDCKSIIQRLGRIGRKTDRIGCQALAQVGKDRQRHSVLSMNGVYRISLQCTSHHP